MNMKQIYRMASPALLLAATTVITGCFATQEDVRVLQADLVTIRNETARSDSLQLAQLNRVIATLGFMNDTLKSVNSRLTRLTIDTRNGISDIGQQLVQIQELTGQSQRRLQEVRASLEARSQEEGTSAQPTSSGNPAETGPGPNQLFQLAREQLVRGSNSVARTAFQDLLNKYPKADVAADAQFYIAETFAAEGNQEAADSVYAEVAKRYPKSPRAATALYKRAGSLATAGDTDEARKLYNTIIKNYPRSDEATLARDRIKALGQ